MIVKMLSSIKISNLFYPTLTDLLRGKSHNKEGRGGRGGEGKEWEGRGGEERAGVAKFSLNN